MSDLCLLVSTILAGRLPGEREGEYDYNAVSLWSEDEEGPPDISLKVTPSLLILLR